MGNGAGRKHSAPRQIEDPSSQPRFFLPAVVRAPMRSPPPTSEGPLVVSEPLTPQVIGAPSSQVAESVKASPTMPTPESDVPARRNSVHSEAGDKGAGGLAARRAAQGRMGNLSVKVEKVAQGLPRRVLLGQLYRAQDASCSRVTARGIQLVEAFDKLYALGAEVMPSVHPGMEIRHAMCLADCSRVVIKVRRKINSFSTAQEEREWRQSAEFMLNLPKSGSIAEIHGVWEDKEYYYVVMEKVGGADLFEVLDSEGLLPMSETKVILRQVLLGVAALHEQGCIHKDLKLENVMVDRSPGGRAGLQDPIVKLIDFDTAQTWEPSSPKANTVLGTDQYIAQEAYAGNYSPASDVFAVGVIAYKLLTGMFPFNGKMFDDEAGENWVGSPKMKQIQERVARAQINWAVPPFNNDAQALDLVRRMLSASEEERPRAEEALRHPFLAELGSPGR